MKEEVKFGQLLEMKVEEWRLILPRFNIEGTEKAVRTSGPRMTMILPMRFKIVKKKKRKRKMTRILRV